MSQPSARDTRAGDAALVARVASGDASALEQIYDRYSRACFSLARRITADTTFAEDVVQEVFLALWRNPDRFDAERGAFASWLLTMTHHKAVDAVRREETLRRRRTESAEATERAAGVEADTATPYEQAWTRIQGERVRSALSELPEAQRSALVLAYFGGYTQREVAKMTATPLGTVKTRMLAGMRRLRPILGTIADNIDSSSKKAGQ